MKPGSARWRVATDVAIALVFTVFCLVVTAHIPPEEGEHYNGWGVVTIIVVGAALLVRRRHPYVTLGIVIAGLATYTVANFAGGPIYLAPLVPLYTIAQRGDRRRTWTAVVATIVLLLPFALVGDRWEQNFVYFLAFAGWVGGAVFLGTAHFSRRAYLAELEQRARYLEESREEEARRRVAEERLRIARDLHDVIAHGIATIHMQSGAALHVLERHPEQAAPALTAIKQLSKQTLDELRMTVGVLRDDEERSARADAGARPARRPDRQRARRRRPDHCRLRPAAGVVPAAVDVAAYRIVQESLTNVMRHAGAQRDGHGDGPPRRRRGHGSRSSTTAVARRRPSTRSRAAGTASPACPSERRPSAGRVVAGPQPGGGFRVLARLPLAGSGGRVATMTFLGRPLGHPRDPRRARRRSGPAPGRLARAARRRGRHRGRRRGRRRRGGDRDRPGQLLPDVVVMDIRMPERRRPRGDPHDRRRSLRSSSVHVVVLTTFDLDEYVFEAIRAGATGLPPEGRRAASSCCGRSGVPRPASRWSRRA